MTEQLDVFISAAIAHGVATEQGDSRVANSQYDRISAASEMLLTQIDLFEKLLEHEEPYVRLWAAGYLMDVDGTRAAARVTLE